MVSSEQKIKEIRDIVKNNPTLSAKEHIEIAQKKGISIRKTDFLKERRDVLNLPEPTKKKIEQSTPIKFRKKVKPTPKKTIQTKLKKIPFKKTKFGKMVKALQKKHGISEQDAIERNRALLKIPKKDFRKLNQKDRDVLTQFGY